MERVFLIGKMVIGTVKGDIHDIGKNLVGMMLEGAGFEVVDLGINNPVENYLSALEEEKPDILGMSALLTTTMPYMKVVIDCLVEKGLRDDYIILVGGAPLNEEFSKAFDAIKSGWISSKGSYVDQFEKKFSKYLGGGYSVTTSSGTTACLLYTSPSPRDS